MKEHTNIYKSLKIKTMYMCVFAMKKTLSIMKNLFSSAGELKLISPFE